MLLRRIRDGLNEEVSLASGTVNDEESLTQQQYVDEVDVNTIVRRMGVSGVMPVLRDDPKFGDFPTVDFHEAMNVVTSTQQAFMRLPAKLRQRFGNDPTELWSWMQDPANDEEAVKLGLLSALPEGVAVKVKETAEPVKPA